MTDSEKDYRDYEVEEYERALRECSEDPGFPSVYDKCKYNCYGLYRLAQGQEAKGEREIAASYYLRSCDYGCRKAFWRLAEGYGSEIRAERICDAFRGLAIHRTWSKTDRNEAERTEAMHRFVQTFEDRADGRTVVYTCLANFYRYLEDDSGFFRLADKAIAGGSMFTAYRKAERLIELARNRPHAEARPLMEEAIELLRLSAEERPESALLLGKELFCGRWTERDEVRAAELLRRAEEQIPKLWIYRAYEVHNDPHWGRFFRRYFFDDRCSAEEEYGDQLSAVRQSGKYSTSLTPDSPEWRVLLDVTASDPEFYTRGPEHRNRFGGYENDTFAIIPGYSPESYVDGSVADRIYLPNLVFKPCGIRFWTCSPFGCSAFLCRKDIDDIARLCIESALADAEAER